MYSCLTGDPLNSTNIGFMIKFIRHEGSEHTETCNTINSRMFETFQRVAFRDVKKVTKGVFGRWCSFGRFARQ